MESLADLQASARRDIRRWLTEADDDALRGTLSAGMLRQAFAYAEKMVCHAAAIFLDCAGEAGAEVLLAVSGGKKKPVGKLTFGECTQLLDMLDARKLIVPRRKAISRADRALLASVTTARNAFAHGSPSAMADGALIRETLENVCALSHLPVIEQAAQASRV